MAIIRNDPFRNFFNLQDQLFRTFDATYGAPKQEAMTAAWSPLVDVFEDQDGISLTAELAGVAEKDVEIQLDGNTLTIRGE
ncbi:MAG TPA: Hsp20/alpha crystallin family protein, partial [Myxococcales bacterium]|nr:Hsp20/alpha crystallin family protein [Myxococcales bacterium]